MKENKNFTEGIRDGIPICLGYFSVAFAFGIFAVDSGLSLWQALIISMTNVTVSPNGPRREYFLLK